VTNSKPKLSVIMTVYNGEDFLQEALDAVMNQTFRDLELVVVNNGSTDGTQAILDSVDDKRLHVVQAPKHGSFGDGIRLAYQNTRGEFIAVQDADDVSFPERFEKQLSVLEANPRMGLVSGKFVIIDQDGNRIGESHIPTRLQGLLDAYQTSNPLAHSTYTYRREAADAVGGYPSEYAYGPDFGLVIRMLKAGWDLHVLPDVILKLRYHQNQTSLAPKLNVIRAHDNLYLSKEASTLNDVSFEARKKGERNITKKTLQYALALIGERCILEGLGHLSSGLFRNPLYASTYLAYCLVRGFGFFKPAKL